MAAGGLFNPDSTPETHANEVVSFGLDIIDEMEQINRNLRVHTRGSCKLQNLEPYF